MNRADVLYDMARVQYTADRLIEHGQDPHEVYDWAQTALAFLRSRLDRFDELDRVAR